MKRFLLLIAIVLGVFACGTTGQVSGETNRISSVVKRPFAWTNPGDHSYINAKVLQAITDNYGLIVENGETSRVACLQSPYLIIYDDMMISGYFVYTGLTYQYTSKDSTAKSVPIVVRLADWKKGFKGVKFE